MKLHLEGLGNRGRVRRGSKTEEGKGGETKGGGSGGGGEEQEEEEEEVSCRFQVLFEPDNYWSEDKEVRERYLERAMKWVKSSDEEEAQAQRQARRQARRQAEAAVAAEEGGGKEMDGKDEDGSDDGDDGDDPVVAPHEPGKVLLLMTPDAIGRPKGV